MADQGRLMGHGWVCGMSGKKKAAAVMDVTHCGSEVADEWQAEQAGTLAEHVFKAACMVARAHGQVCWWQHTGGINMWCGTDWWWSSWCPVA